MEKLRPLTDEERRFASENHSLVFAFINEKALDENVFYDVVIFGYMRAVQEYISNSKACRYAFSTIAWKRMQRSVINYCHYLMKPKRFAEIVSLTDPIDEASDLTWEDVLISEESKFLEFEMKELLRELDKELPILEMKIIRMKLAGFKMHEIAKTEHLTFQEINTLLADCKDDIIRILWGDEQKIAA